MPNLSESHVQEIASAPVGALFTSTMNALIDGQASAAIKSADLFHELAYDIDSTTGKKTLRYLDLTYDRANPDFDPSTAGSLPSLRHTVSMPEIMMYNMPFLKIQEATFDFNVKIDSMEYEKKSTETNVSADLSFRARLGWWGNLNVSSSFSHQAKRESGHEVNRSYALGVKATVVHDDLPEGFEIMQGIFKKAVMENSAANPVPSE